jgi:hypothetical protein
MQRIVASLFTGGATFTREYTLPNGTKATAAYTITEKPVPSRKAGIILREGEKTVGKPHLWGLEHDETLSDRFLRPRGYRICKPSRNLGRL